MSPGWRPYTLNSGESSMPTKNPTTRAQLRRIRQSEGYLYGSDGSVWSQWGKGYDTPTGPWRRLKPTHHKSGHPQLRVKIDGKSTHVTVHKMICWAFHGKCPRGKECRHLDGDSTNNRSTNLIWGTRAENIGDQASHGVLAVGERIGIAKLNSTKVKLIRRLYASGKHTQRSLGRRFGVTHSTIKLIVNYSTWRHVK